MARSPDLDVVSSQAFLVTPSVLLMINRSLLQTVRTYANPNRLSRLLPQGMLEIGFCNYTCGAAALFG